MAENKKNEESELEIKLYSLFMPLTSNINMPGLKVKLNQSDSKDDLDYYLSKYLFYAIFIPFLLFVLGFFLLLFLGKNDSVFTLIFICVIVGVLIIIYSFIKPYLDVGRKVASIKNNLALAILSMSSIAESGAPPEAMFFTSTNRKETPYLSREFKKITNYMDNLGLSLIEAINHVCDKTPSLELKKFLIEMKSNIESGGSLSEFMKQKAEHSQFQYNLMLNNMNKKAETFGDIYSAVVIAGPLFLFTTIMLLGMIGGGGIAGMSVASLLTIGIFLVIPIINILFLVVLQMVA